MIRRLSWSFALALVVAACTGTGAGTTTTGAPATTTTAGNATSTTSAQPTTTASPNGPLPGTEDLDPTVRADLEHLVAATEEIRELQFEEMPVITVVTPEELEERVRSQIAEDAADFPSDQALYRTLGLLGEDTDLEALLTDLYGEQVAAYYDGDAKELVVPLREEDFSVSERGILIHELTHALTDQHFGFDAILNEMADNDRLDQFSAYQALVEGDASLAMLHYLQTLSMEEMGEYLAESLDTDFSNLEAAPTFIQDTLYFPYDSGLAFNQELYDFGGWDAINDAYTSMPGLPGSTEQVISPSDFERDLPKEIEGPDTSVPGYEKVRTSVWGELGFRIMLDQILGQAVGVKAADGWGGDSYDQWFDGTNAAMKIVYQGDTNRDTEELRSALADYTELAIDEEDFSSVAVDGGRLVFVVADDPTVGAVLAG